MKTFGREGERKRTSYRWVFARTTEEINELGQKRRGPLKKGGKETIQEAEERGSGERSSEASEDGAGL